MTIKFMTANLWKKPKFIMAFSLCLFFVFAALFFKVLDEVWLEHEFLLLDRVTTHLMTNNHLQEPYDWRFFLTVTYLGNGVILAGLTLILVALLWFRRAKAESVFFAGGFALTGISVVLFKIVTDRIRPAGASFLNETSGAFPSGHAALSFFFYGFLGYLLCRRIKNKSHAFLVFAASLSIAGLIGISRIYLNVHWVTDVLAGFALAAAILSLCIGVLETWKLRFLQ
ncbi:MAG: phosphatase PAP2 family protein [Alphaproteobacteria bacterium]|nr:phosphatase PAP2 family protein [Alphaproteobacteria bacterium]